MQSDLLVFLTALAGFVTAVVAGLIILWKELRHVHKTVNSRMDELLDLTRKSARAEGVIEGRKEDRPSKPRDPR